MESRLVAQSFKQRYKWKAMVDIKNLIIYRKYYIQVNDYKLPIFQSIVGIPQCSVISPVLCNMYTTDSMSNIVNNHAEFADDSSVLNNVSSIT